MPQYDHDSNEYSPIMDAEQRAAKRRARGWKEEWYVQIVPNSYKHARLVSRTHDDDVELVITGNFSDVQRNRLAHELCAQLNRAELEDAKEFDEAEPHFRPTNLVDPDGADMLRKVIPPGLLEQGEQTRNGPPSSE